MLGLTVVGGRSILRALAAESTSRTDPTAIPPLPKLQAQVERVKTPQDLDELRRLERQCVEVVTKVRPAVVGVMAPSKASLPKTSPHVRGASGVIIMGERKFLSSLHDDVRTCVVSITNGGQNIALGTEVDADGLAVTKATHLPPQPQYRLPDGTTKDVTVIGVDKAFDVAIIRIPDSGSQSVKWASNELGTLRISERGVIPVPSPCECLPYSAGPRS